MALVILELMVASLCPGPSVSTSRAVAQVVLAAVDRAEHPGRLGLVGKAIVLADVNDADSEGDVAGLQVSPCGREVGPKATVDILREEECVSISVSALNEISRHVESIELVAPKNPCGAADHLTGSTGTLDHGRRGREHGSWRRDARPTQHGQVVRTGARIGRRERHGIRIRPAPRINVARVGRVPRPPDTPLLFTSSGHVSVEKTGTGIGFPEASLPVKGTPVELKIPPACVSSRANAG